MHKLAIQTVETGAGFEDIIAGASEDIQAIAREARKLLADVMPGITEVPWARQKIAGYGVGPKKMSEHFCYIAPQTKHVNLGFFYGADLHDPDGLLEGSGKALRHVKLESLASLENPALTDLIKQASTHLPKLTS